MNFRLTSVAIYKYQFQSEFQTLNLKVTNICVNICVNWGQNTFFKANGTTGSRGKFRDNGGGRKMIFLFSFPTVPSIKSLSRLAQFDIKHV